MKDAITLGVPMSKEAIYKLKKEISELEDDVERLSAMEQAVKIVLNGGYGAIGSPAFRWYDETIAEGITSTGQVAIRYITKKLNEFINLHSGTEGIDYICSSDTDSVVGSTIIDVSGKYISISDYYDGAGEDYIKFDRSNENYVKRVNSSDKTFSVGKNSVVNYNRIKYVMRHLVEKRIFKITVGGKSVELTEDHSIIVKMKDSGEIKSIKPVDLDRAKHFLINIVRTDRDRVVTINEQKNDFIV